MATTESSLAPRAAEVLALVQAGNTATTIAEELSISRNAVYQHIGNLRDWGYLPPREGKGSGAELSVDSTVEQFRSTLVTNMQRIDARITQLEDELTRLREERMRVTSHLDRINA